MDNFDFVPPNIEKSRFNNKLKLYKGITLIMWMCCLALFIQYTFQSNKNKALTKRNEDIKAENKIIAYDIPGNRNIPEINTLKKYLSNLQGSISYKVMSINDKKIEMEVLIDGMNQYYEILNLIENKCGYKILSLSPPVSDDGSMTFKILFEVM